MMYRDERPPDAGPDGMLDAYLNERSRGNPSPQTGLDASMVAAVHRLQDLADATLAANISGADEARTWAALVGPASRPRLVALPPIHAAASDAATTPVPVATASGEGNRMEGGTLVRIVPISGRPTRMRRIGSRSLGLVATMTLVALIGLSGLAVYLSAPRADDRDGGPLFAGASPTAETVPTDLRQIIPSACVQQPRDYDELMGTIAARLSEEEAGRVQEQTLGATSGINPSDPSLPWFQLPDGPAPDDASQAAVVGIMDQFTSCPTLRAASLTTDDYWYRVVSQPYGGLPLALLWSDGQFDQAILFPEPLSSTPMATIAARPDGGLPLYEIYGFRLLPGKRIGAYLRPGARLTGSAAAPTESVDTAYDQRGYVIVAQQADGRWLIDELRSPPFQVPAPCDVGCATPVAP